MMSGASALSAQRLPVWVSAGGEVRGRDNAVVNSSLNLVCMRPPSGGGVRGQLGISIFWPFLSAAFVRAVSGAAAVAAGASANEALWFLLTNACWESTWCNLLRVPKKRRKEGKKKKDNKSGSIRPLDSCFYLMFVWQLF